MGRNHRHSNKNKVTPKPTTDNSYSPNSLGGRVSCETYEKLLAMTNQSESNDTANDKKSVQGKGETQPREEKAN
jgi:hypothetical protein